MKEKAPKQVLDQQSFTSACLRSTVEGPQVVEALWSALEAALEAALKASPLPQPQPIPETCVQAKVARDALVAAIVADGRAAWDSRGQLDSVSYGSRYFRCGMTPRRVPGVQNLAGAWYAIAQ